MRSPFQPRRASAIPARFSPRSRPVSGAGFALPEFASDAIQRVLAEEPPPRHGDLVLGHNDLNPTNFIYDGEGLLVLDWAAAGPMDAFYDLAVLAVFLRMDEATCLSLLSAYDGAPSTALPDRFPTAAGWRPRSPARCSSSSRAR